MDKNSKRKFHFKIIISYLILAVLALVSAYFIYSEIQVFLNDETTNNDDLKLLESGTLVTDLYEAESLSKLALQNKTKLSFQAYSNKIDTILTEIDTLKGLSNSGYQHDLLDSVQLLLRQKVANNQELLNLKVRSEANNSIDNALAELRKMEASFGKLTIENFEQNPEKLSAYERKVLEDWVAYLNSNIPADTTNIPNGRQIDSILNASKALLAEAKRNDAQTQRFLSSKEQQINRNDLELSQQLRTIMTAFEQEVMTNTYNENIKKRSALRRTMRLAGITALMGFLIVAVFTFLINRDFWKIQTYRDQLEKEKRYSESLLKSREQLISTVSHDLRSPLNTINGYTELMDNTSLSDKQRGYLKNVRSALQYVGNLVNDLLDFSKLEAGKLKIEHTPFILAHLVQETAENLQALHKDKNLKLYLEIDPALEKTVLGDSFRVKQILTNLIGNAFKFTEEGHIKITATASRQGKSELTARIDVVDTGIGIPKEKQKLIFKEFTQADSDTEKRFGGYGLGLTISNKLSELLKGSLTLESKVGQGSTFTLRLPLTLSDKPLKPEQQDMPYMAPKLRMLIVDDDTALLGMLRELCESMGITAHTFTNFLFIEEDSHLAYDLVLTDIQMPQISGFEVLKKLKSGAYKHYKDQPIIAMTGRKDLEDDSYKSLGFSQVLQKPFTKGELITVLKLLGIQTEKPNRTETNFLQKMEGPKHYSLDIIHSFLGTNVDAVNEVLVTFLQDTRTNMKLLKETVGAGDYDQVGHVAHRMLPMFRQLRAETSVSILERFETASPQHLTKEELNQDFQRLQGYVKVLTKEMSQRLATTSPSYTG